MAHRTDHRCHRSWHCIVVTWNCIREREGVKKNERLVEKFCCISDLSKKL